MTEGSINKVLYNVDQRADTTEAEKKTARDNIGALGPDDIPSVVDDRYKLLQSPLLQTFAANAVIDRFEQNAQGVATIHCSYLTVATQESNGLMSVSDKVKLDTVGYNAEQNVQVDWLCDDPTSDQYILNRPSITLQEQADWTELNDTLPSYIKHKPTIPSGDQLVPPATSADDGKILVVDPDGHPEWQDAGAGLLTVAHDGTLSGDGTVSAPLGVNLDEVQGKLTPGTGITIEGDVISAAAALTAGNGIRIVDDVISAKVDGTSIGFDQQGNIALVAPIVLNSGNTTTVVNGGGTSVTNNTTHASTTINSSGVTLSDGTTTDTFDLTDLQKLNGIEAGAEVNVNADWLAVSGDAEILNKPDLSIYATQTDLSGKQDTLTAGDNISIVNNVISATAAPQLNSDWDATSGVQEILHKPNLSIYATQTDLSGKQDTLTAGDNISIVNNVISAASQVNSDWDATSGVQEILNKPQNLVQDADYHHTDNNFTTSEKTKLAGVQAGAEQNVQSDWDQTDTSADDFIKNKPTIPVVPPLKELVAGSGVTMVESAYAVTISTAAGTVVDANYVHTDNNFSNSYKNKLNDIESGAEVNVQSNWTETNTSSDAFIKNKPTVPELSWQQETQGSSNSFPADQLKIHQDYHTVTMHTTGGSDVQLGYVVPNPQSADDGKVLKAIDNGVGGTSIAWGDAPNADWNASSGAAEILNKPSIPDIVSTTTSLPPVDTDIATLRVFTDGRVQGDSSTLGCLAPVPTQADSGKVLVAYWAGSPAIGTARWEPAPEGHTVGFIDIQIGEIP